MNNNFNNQFNVSEQELDKMINSPSPIMRMIAVKYHNYGMDKLIDDPDPLVRYAIAERGYGLDQLINDEDPYVRAAAYGLDKLIYDADSIVKFIEDNKLLSSNSYNNINPQSSNQSQSIYISSNNNAQKIN